MAEIRRSSSGPFSETVSAVREAGSSIIGSVKAVGSRVRNGSSRSSILSVLSRSSTGSSTSSMNVPTHAELPGSPPPSSSASSQRRNSINSNSSSSSFNAVTSGIKRVGSWLSRSVSLRSLTRSPSSDGSDSRNQISDDPFARPPREEQWNAKLPRRSVSEKSRQNFENSDEGQNSELLGNVAEQIFNLKNSLTSSKTFSDSYLKQSESRRDSKGNSTIASAPTLDHIKSLAVLESGIASIGGCVELLKKEYLLAKENSRYKEEFLFNCQELSAYQEECDKHLSDLYKVDKDRVQLLINRLDSFSEDFQKIEKYSSSFINISRQEARSNQFSSEIIKNPVEQFDRIMAETSANDARAKGEENRFKNNSSQPSIAVAEANASPVSLQDNHARYDPFDSLIESGLKSQKNTNTVEMINQPNYQTLVAYAAFCRVPLNQDSTKAQSDSDIVAKINMFNFLFAQNKNSLKSSQERFTLNIRNPNSDADPISNSVQSKKKGIFR